MKNTVVINLWAGPGAGKTTCAWEIASQLKKLGYVTEYVSEYAKELVWENNTEMIDGSLEHQREILKEQTRRVDRLHGKVDFIVTDSPILLNALYVRGSDQEKLSYEKEVDAIFSQYSNFSIFVQRGNAFETEGRIHTQKESVSLDEDVKAMLGRHGIFYGKYTYQTIGKAIDNCVYTHNRLNGKPQKIKTAQLEK